MVSPFSAVCSARLSPGTYGEMLRNRCPLKRTHLLVAVYGSTRDEAEEMKLWGFIGVLWRLCLLLFLNPVGAEANYVLAPVQSFGVGLM